MGEGRYWNSLFSLREDSSDGYRREHALEIHVSQFHQFVTTTLADRKIDDAEVELIREQLYQDGRLDLEDVRLLVELYCHSSQHCPALEGLFFNVLKEVILADGEIRPSEEYYLLKMLYCDREIRPSEKQFLRDLARKAAHVPPEFAALCREAFQAPATGWDVGGVSPAPMP